MNKLLTIKRSPESIMMLAACIAAMISFAVTVYDYPEATGSIAVTAFCGSAAMILLTRSKQIMQKHEIRLRDAVVLRSLAFLFPSVCHELLISGWTAVIFLPLMYALAMVPIAAAVFIAYLCREEDGAMTRGILIYGAVSVLSSLAYMMVAAPGFASILFCTVQTILGYCLLRWKDRNRSVSGTGYEYGIYWKTWNAASLLLLISRIFPDPVQKFVFLHYWHPLLLIGLPFLLPVFFHQLTGLKDRRKPASFKTGKLPENCRSRIFLGCCLLLFAFLQSILIFCGNNSPAGTAISGIYFILMTVLVFQTESAKENRIENSVEQGSFDSRELFAFVAAVLLFSFSVPSLANRILPETEAAKGNMSSLQQNEAEISQNPAAARSEGLVNLLEKESRDCLSFEYGNAIGNAYGRHRLPLVLFCLCVTVLSVRVTELKRSAKMVRMGRYAAFGWVIRTVLYLLVTAASVPSDWTLMPFTGICVPELFVLSSFLFGKDPWEEELLRQKCIEKIRSMPIRAGIWHGLQRVP